VTEAAELATGGISGALVLRARALLGDDAAAAMLHPESIRLRAPGIALHAVYDARS